MFRAELESKLKDIFGFRKLSFNAPSDQFEQDTLFVAIEESMTRVNGGNEFAKVMGSITVFCQADKMPFGFFSKRIEKADAAQTKNLFFFERDVNVLNSQARIINIDERRCRFVFLYSGQFDPNQGEMNQLEIEEQS